MFSEVYIHRITPPGMVGKTYVNGDILHILWETDADAALLDQVPAGAEALIEHTLTPEPIYEALEKRGIKHSGWFG